VCTKPLVAGREPFPETGPELDEAAAAAAAASSPRRVASSDVRQEPDPDSMSPAGCKIGSSIISSADAII
jgi:hypothetical protein